MTAFHEVEPEVERELPGASYKAILREGARGRRGGPGSTASDGERLVAGWHTIEAFADTVAALEELHAAGLEARHPDQLRRRPVRVDPAGARASRSTWS